MEKRMPFRFWCQKVLPLVYDDSLSYYELLCKVISYINNMIDDLNTFDERLNELKATLDTLPKLVEDNVEKKLDELAETGFFEELFEKSSFYLKQDTICDLWGNIYSNFGNLNGCTYIGDGDYVGYFNKSYMNSNTGVLVRFNIEQGIRWNYNMPLQHGNSICYVPSTNRIYVCANYSISSNGVSTENNLVFKIDLDNPTVIEDTIIVQGVDRVGGIGYDIKTGLFYSDGSFSSQEYVGNKVNVYTDEFQTISKVVYLENYPPVVYKDNVTYNQGISAVVNGNIFSACHWNVKGIGVWSAENGALRGFYEIPEILNSYRDVGEMQTCLYDYDENILMFASVAFNQGVETGYNIANIVRTNIIGNILKGSIMPALTGGSDVRNGVTLDFSKTLLPPHRRNYANGIKLLSLCDCANLSKSLNTALIVQPYRENSDAVNIWMSTTRLVGGNISILSNANNVFKFGPMYLTDCNVSFVGTDFVSAFSNNQLDTGNDRTCFIYANGSTVRFERCAIDNSQTNSNGKYGIVSFNSRITIDDANSFFKARNTTSNVSGYMGTDVTFINRSSTNLLLYPSCVLHNCYQLVTIPLASSSTLTINAPYVKRAKVYMCLGDHTTLVGGGFREPFKFAETLGVSASQIITAFVQGIYSTSDTSNSTATLTITNGKQQTLNADGSITIKDYTASDISAVAIEMP